MSGFSVALEERQLTSEKAVYVKRPKYLLGRFVFRSCMTIMIKIEAYRIKQKGKDIYLSSIKAGDLIKIYDTDRWSKTRVEGYQRALARSRVSMAARYLREEDGLFPTSVLLNVRGVLRFEPIENLDGVERGILTVPEESMPLWVVDGQHRIEALRLAIPESPEFNDYMIPVSIFNLHDSFEEMRMFYVVNSRQRSVPTDLALHHLHRTIMERGQYRVLPYEPEQRVFAAQSLDVVKVLNTDATSPWLGRVQAPNEPKGPNHIIKERPLADSIGYILKEMTTSQVRDVQKNPRILAEPLIEYWNALKEIFPDAFANPQEYTIQRTTGTYSLNMIYTKVAKLCEKASASNKKDEFKNLLGDMFKDIAQSQGVSSDSDFWHKETGYPLALGTSMKLIKSLASLFLDNLRED
jgi:DNA sulfur modification protein DndB